MFVHLCKIAHAYFDRSPQTAPDISPRGSSFVRFLVYFFFLRSPHTTGENISFAAKAGAGLVGGALAVCIGTPFDVALVRMQADTMKPQMERRNYGGVGDALRRIGD